MSLGRRRPRGAAPSGSSKPAGVGAESPAGEVASDTAPEPVNAVRPPLGLPSPPLIHPGLGFSLRPWGTTPTDDQALVAAWADPDIARYCAVPRSQDLSAANRWIAHEERRRRSGTAIDLVISELGAPEHIGGEVGLVVVDPERRWAEIGYWIASKARGQGVASAAVGLVAEWTLRSLPIARIVARTHPDNPASATVAKRAGFAAAGSLADGTNVWTLDAPSP